MRFRDPLNDVFGRRSKVALLRQLVRFRRGSTGRDLARSTVLDHKTCHDALRDLQRHHVVVRQRIGTASAYSLNSDHPIVRGVLEPAFAWERGLLEEFARDVRRLLGPGALSIILFGSTVRGEEDPDSDVDLLIVTRDRAGSRALERKLDRGSGPAIERYARFPQYIFADLRTFRGRVRGGDRLFSEIVRTGRVLHGLQIKEILGHDPPAHQRSKGPRR